MAAYEARSINLRSACASALLVAAGAGAGLAIGELTPDILKGLALPAGVIAFAAAVLCLLGLNLMNRLPRSGRQPEAGEAAEQSLPVPPTPMRQIQPGDIVVPAEGPVIDQDTLDGLRRLGDEAFVVEVISQFISEGVLALFKIAQAIGEADAVEYAGQVHALRSSAANVGARRLYKLCLEWRELTSEELAGTGGVRFVHLQKEFLAAEKILKDREAQFSRKVAISAAAG
jgi:hypothetical protein